MKDGGQPIRHELHLDGTDYRGQDPTTVFHTYDEGLLVRCIDWPDEARAIDSLYTLVMATWGERSRVPTDASLDVKKRVAELALKGKALPAALQCMQYTFAIDGVTRATTHQLVRHHAGIVQHSQRANDERHAAVRIPIQLQEATDPQLLERYINACKAAKKLYADMTDAGIPVQDSRAILPEFTETYLVMTWDYAVMQGALALRMCHNSGPEMVMVAQKMRDEVRRVTPWLGQYLGIMCELAGRCNYEDKYVGHNDMQVCGTPYEKPHDPASYKYTRDQNGALKWLNRPNTKLV